MHFLAISSIIRNFSTQKKAESQSYSQPQQDIMATSSQHTGNVPSEDPKTGGGGVLSNLMEGKTPGMKNIEGAWSRAGAGNHGTAGECALSIQLVLFSHIYIFSMDGRVI